MKCQADRVFGVGSFFLAVAARSCPLRRSAHAPSQSGSHHSISSPRLLASPHQNPTSHRVIEKRRRDRMNSSLSRLSKLIPPDFIKKVQSLFCGIPMSRARIPGPRAGGENGDHRDGNLLHH